MAPIVVLTLWSLQDRPSTQTTIETSINFWPYLYHIIYLDSVWKDGECYDDYDPRLLERHLTSQEDMTPELCIEKCKDNAYSYAGVQYRNECWCGGTKPPKEEKRPKSECKLACTGDSSIMCGGQYRMNIYFVGKNLH
jgi:hypothetical protein